MPVMRRAINTLVRRLRRDERGVSFVEFALILPVLVTLGFYGTELAWMSMVNMQVGQIASSLADNASRLGQTDNSAVTPNVKETDIDSVMNGALVQGSYFNFAATGRIILSSLERDTATGRQYIHWQRCRGSLKVKSQYGVEGAGKTGTILPGMGKPNLTAVANSAVMYVEVNYVYQPLFGSWFVGNPTFRREAAFIIRDDRNLTLGVTGTNNSSCA
ncbi:TadE/TadG family type IV pilus assembly protein [Novosphingobium gossypii]|uniref:TadE/TadG family type IV pilus assembly protein n=1 Tax=Novosphingobium gossypii TaxID=1604774 RepID=UPI003D195C0F